MPKQKAVLMGFWQIVKRLLGRSEATPATVPTSYNVKSRPQPRRFVHPPPLHPLTQGQSTDPLTPQRPKNPNSHYFWTKAKSCRVWHIMTWYKNSTDSFPLCNPNVVYKRSECEISPDAPQGQTCKRCQEEQKKYGWVREDGANYATFE